MILVISTIIVTGIVFVINKNNKIPDGYIAVFHGGSGEIIFETYVYKNNDRQTNSGFDYINTTSTTTYWGSGEWKTRITDRGHVQWSDAVFEVAKVNNAYSYVTLPNSDKTYTIEEYMQLFLMN